MMCGKVSGHLLFIEKNGEKWKKELEKEEKQENGKSRKADKNKEISYMWKNGKKSRK